ncbi:L-serine ammonia-lyase, iron-sulfur-dependent subunit beta [Paenibacillus wynnii]|uniref:L-serine deaminase n=1 Tax=Paenibacillus wynnii TaxID=268407 RepID=A0A098M4S7_9BACL|nr:L-serine ammonia-lyase, iron-sulfur-dependent subunit beta [Paenibacillus wynnii]KGE17056.1 serine dehydratase [Paenibacillus wynnii]
MRFKDVFSIIGPSMIGPSSSHTAGAVRLGLTARSIFGCLPESAEIMLYGSFADTYRGHGTDMAIVGGILDYSPDDPRIRDSLNSAQRAGIRIDFRTAVKPTAHPNTVTIILQGSCREDRITGSSIGGGNIEITNVNEFDVRFTTMYPTLLIFHDDRTGMIADVTRILCNSGVNISHMDVDRKSRKGDALTVIEMDGELPQLVVQSISALPNIHRICTVNQRGESCELHVT